MTKIARFYELGGPEVLKLEEVEDTEPGGGEVRVRIKALGLNRAEALFMRGLYLAQPSFPSRIGAEGLGVIEAVGEGVDWSVGDEVCITPNFDFAKTGIAGETAIVPESALVPRPAGLSDAEAASVWMAYPTAYGGLVEWGGLKRDAGQSAVITAASSSVGFAAIQLCTMMGVQPIATTRTSAKKEQLLAAGAEIVVATQEEDLKAVVKDATAGRGADVVFDPIAGPFMDTAAEVVAPEGTIVPYGALAMAPTAYPLFAAMMKGFSIRAFHVVLHLMQHRERWERAKAIITDGLDAGRLKPVIDTTFPLERIAEAYQHLESNTQAGKVVVTVS
jgi:NADPH:quinone reductase-like Zn-dependent oxidoreductase